MSANKNDEQTQKEEQSISTRFDEAFPSENAQSALASENSEQLQAQIETLNKKLSEIQEKANNHWEMLLRKEADLQNNQRRAQEEIEKARKFAIERFAQEVLEIADSIEQGLSYAQNGQATVEHLTEGMTLTQSVLSNIFEKEGIKLINPQGELFNPTYHEALSMQETTEVEPNKVVFVVQKGYMLHNRLLRPARVVVAKAPAAD